jgi:hypothetical protein
MALFNRTLPPYAAVEQRVRAFPLVQNARAARRTPYTLHAVATHGTSAMLLHISAV